MLSWKRTSSASMKSSQNINTPFFRNYLTIIFKSTYLWKLYNVQLKCPTTFCNSKILCSIATLVVNHACRTNFHKNAASILKALTTISYHPAWHCIRFQILNRDVLFVRYRFSISATRGVGTHARVGRFTVYRDLFTENNTWYVVWICSRMNVRLFRSSAKV